jgi:hypothetical protein
LGMYISKGPYIGGAYFRQNSTNSDALIIWLVLELKK